MKNNIKPRLKKIFVNLFGIAAKDIQSDSSPNTILNWDSLQHLNLVASIEEEFSIHLEEEDIVEMLSFGLTLQIVQNHMRTSD